jgi:hypothetical protein
MLLTDDAILARVEAQEHYLGAENLSNRVTWSHAADGSLTETLVRRGDTNGHPATLSVIGRINTSNMYMTADNGVAASHMTEWQVCSARPCMLVLD